MKRTNFNAIGPDIETDMLSGDAGMRNHNRGWRTASDGVLVNRQVKFVTSRRPGQDAQSPSCLDRNTEIHDQLIEE